MRKGSDKPAKGKPRGKPFPKKETALETPTPVTNPASDEERLEALQRKLMDRLAAANAPLTEEEVGPAPEPPPVPAAAPADLDAQIRAAMPKLAPLPTAAPPRIEQEVTLESLVAQQQAPAEPAFKAPPRRPGETTLQYTERLADLMVAAETERRKRILEARRLKKPIGNLPAYSIQIPTRRDAAAVPEGAQTTPGFWQTWIPTTNTFGEPDPQLSKVQQMRDWDYRVVTDADGKPVQGRLGVLMEGSPDRRAARVAHLTQPGARRARETEESVYQFVEQTNREHGKRVLIAQDYSDKG